MGQLTVGAAGTIGTRIALRTGQGRSIGAALI